MTPASHSNGIRNGLVFLLVASVASAIGGLPFNTLPIVLGGFADSLRLDASQIGTLGSACTGGYLLSTLLGPLWVERINWRLATALAAAGCIGALLVSTRQSGPPYLPLALFGFAAGLMHSLGMRMVGEILNKERAFGTRLLTELVLVALLLLLLPVIMARSGLGGGMLMISAAVFLMSLSAIFIPPGPAIATQSSLQTASASGDTVRVAWVALGIFTFFACGQVALWVFIERIGKSIDASPEQMGLIFSVLKIIGGASAALVAMLGTRLGNRWPHWIVFAGILIGVALMQARSSFGVYALGAWTWEAFFTIGCVYQTAAVARLDTSNRLVVLVPAAFAISAFVGPELAGRLAQTGGFGPLFFLAAVCAAIPAIAYLMLARRMRQ